MSIGLIRSTVMATVLGLSIANSATVPAGATVTNNYAPLAQLPDWGGVWHVDMTIGVGGPASPTGLFGPTVPLIPALRAKFGPAGPQFNRGSGSAAEALSKSCMPGGMPEELSSPFGFEFLFTPGRVTMALEYESQIRRIYTDGRPIDPDPDITFNGTSTGHWENGKPGLGQTLVVDTVGLRPQNLADTGLPVTQPFRLRELIHLIAPDELEIDTTVFAPEVLTAPFTYSAKYKRHRDWTMEEYVCQENPRDFVGPDGKAQINLDLDSQ